MSALRNPTRARVILSGQTGTGASAWFPLRDYADPSIHVEGMQAGDVLQVQVSNDEGTRTAITNIVQQGPDITADGPYLIEPGMKWMRLNRSADAGGGSVTVTM